MLDEERLIETEAKGIYRDLSNYALIVKKDSQYRDLLRRIKQLEAKIFQLEEEIKKLNNRE
ncbi:MAG: hypothetical protein N3A54_00905 [Patescibacteria group bacterium]|nr:hypothetical protein [Patescibacteria group bacterium]